MKRIILHCASDENKVAFNSYKFEIIQRAK